ncbi:hypothetical protein [Marinomonas sp.]|uniref:hypothetical protein n=1 Tax=Marinomonas sp. TaxID=1904862 RepID=UPI003F94E9A3
MILTARVVLVLLSFVLSAHAFARSDIPIENGSGFLVSACQEVVDIYDKRGQAKLLAGQRTSLNEGIRAGYCMGVTKQYREHARGCGFAARSWFKMAEIIAHTNMTESQLKRTRTSDILQEAYCGL